MSPLRVHPRADDEELIAKYAYDPDAASKPGFFGLVRASEATRRVLLRQRHVRSQGSKPKPVVSVLPEGETPEAFRKRVYQHICAFAGIDSHPI